MSLFRNLGKKSSLGEDIYSGNSLRAWFFICIQSLFYRNKAFPLFREIERRYMCVHISVLQNEIYRAPFLHQTVVYMRPNLYFLNSVYKAMPVEDIDTYFGMSRWTRRKWEEISQENILLNFHLNYFCLSQDCMSS